jgi:hypothetical protein
MACISIFGTMRRSARLQSSSFREEMKSKYFVNCNECSTYKLAGQKRSAACCNHHISTKALRTLILETVKATSTYAASNETEFMQKVREASQVQQEKTAKDLKRKLNKDKRRCEELDTIIKKLYESYAVGRIGEDRFDALLSEYEQEQTALRQAITEAEAYGECCPGINGMTTTAGQPALARHY